MRSIRNPTLPLPTFADIKRAIPSLSLQQREELVLWCKAVPGAAVSVGKEAPTTIEPDDWLASAIGRALVKRGMATSKGIGGHLRNAVARVPNYPSASREVRDLLRSHLNENPTERQLQHLGDIAIGALINVIEISGPSKELIAELVTLKVPGTVIARIRKMGSPELSARRLLTNIGRVPGALDKELPNYMAAGLLTMVVGKR